MPFSKYDQYFGGTKGAAAKAHRAMVSKYGDKADAVFYGKVNAMKKRKKKGKSKSYSEAVADLRGEASAMNGPNEEKVAAASAVIEEMYVHGLTAIQDGDLSLEAVTAAVQAAVSSQAKGADGNVAHSPCTVLATFVGSCIYEHEGKLYQIDYKLTGTDAELVGDAAEVTAEFVPAPPSMMQEAAALIEARPATALMTHGRLKRDLNIIEGTVLITAHSVNGAGKGGRRYSDTALKQIAVMAEGLPAYLNHVAPDQAFKPRDVKDLIGVHRNVRYFPTEGKIVSDLHIAEHQAPLVFGLAEKLGNHIGNSLVSRGLVQMEGDTEIVKEIDAVRSADLVSDPATTKGLFESRAEDPDPFATLIMELREALTAVPLHPQPSKEEPVMDLAAILSYLKDKPGDQKLLAEHFGFVPKPDAEKLQEQVITLTTERDAVAKQATDLQAEQARVTTVLNEAKVALDAYKAKDALAEKRAKIVTMIEGHDLGKQFGKVKDAISDEFKSLLEEVDEAKWTKHLDDRFKALKGVPSGATPSSQPKPESLMEQHDDNKPLPEGIEARLAAAL